MILRNTSGKGTINKNIKINIKYGIPLESKNGNVNKCNKNLL